MDEFILEVDFMVEYYFIVDIGYPILKVGKEEIMLSVVLWSKNTINLVVPEDTE